MSDTPLIVPNEQQTPRVESRAADTRQDSTDTAPIAVTLKTIDTAVLSHLSKRIKPAVTQDGSQVKVPVMYGDPERWKSVQRDGVFRDSIGKIQLPMLLVRRASMKKTGINSVVNKQYERLFQTGWSRRTPYDQFSVTNGIVPSREYYITAVPDYYELTYQCLIWTEYMEQMNSVVEDISFESDEFWGDPNSYKFRAIVKSFEQLNDLPSSADRVVRTKFDITVFGYLLPDSMLNEGLTRGTVTRKRYGVKKIVTFTETDTE